MGGGFGFYCRVGTLTLSFLNIFKGGAVLRAPEGTGTKPFLGQNSKKLPCFTEFSRKMMVAQSTKSGGMEDI